MIQKVYNIEEYIMGMLALGISIPTSWREYAEHIDLPFNNYYLSQTASKLKGEGKIRVQDKRVYLKPKGIESIREIFGKTMYEHYMSISNEHNLNGLERRNRVIRLSQTVNFCVLNGYGVDGIKFEYHQNFLGRTKELDNLLTSIEGNTEDRFLGFSENLAQRVMTETDFYNSRYIKQGDKVKRIGYRANLSKALGFLIAGTNPYMVYAPTTEIYPATENPLRQPLTLMLKDLYGKTNINAIVMVSDVNEIKTLSASFEDMYDKVIVVPVVNTKDFKQTDGKYIVDILSSDNDIKDYLYYENEDGDGISDGFINGRPSWEFISSDFSKITEIKSYGKDKIHIICYEWQKGIIDEMLGLDIEYMVLTDKRKSQLKDLIGGRI